MGIYTSRYSNKELADGKYYCVGISIGTPKFKLAYRLENQCYSLAPKVYAENEPGRFQESLLREAERHRQGQNHQHGCEDGT